MSEETKNTETQVETPESQEVVTETTLVSEEITTAEGTTEAAAVSEETITKMIRKRKLDHTLYTINTYQD